MWQDNIPLYLAQVSSFILYCATAVVGVYFCHNGMSGMRYKFPDAQEENTLKDCIV